MEAKKLFDVISDLGEGLHDSLHIIDISEGDSEKFRVYHSDGFCFDIEKEYIEDLEEFRAEFGNVDTDGSYYYFDSDQFEGFKKLSVNEAISLIKLTKP